MILCLHLLLSLLACSDKPTPAQPDSQAPADPDADGDGVPASQDCDDENASAWPGAPEACDGADTDCDGLDDNDEDDIVSYPDEDGDGHGASDAPITGCDAPTGALPTGDDCDDAEAGIHPDAPETCDGVDQDCDGAVDEDPSDGDTWYADADHDGYGDDASARLTCDSPGAAWTETPGDCDDTSDTISPEGLEICDGALDEDCDGEVDEGYYRDADGDGLGDDSACEPGETSVTNSADDDDGSPLGPADPCPPYSGVVASGLSWTLDEGDVTYTFTQDPVVSEAGGLSVTDHKVGAGLSGGCDYSSETTRVWRCDADGLWLLSTTSETTLSSCGASDGTKTSETVFDGDGLLTLPAGLALHDSWEGYATAGGSTWYYAAYLEYYGEVYADPVGRGDELYELAWVWTEELHPLEGTWLHRTLGAFEAEASYAW